MPPTLVLHPREVPSSRTPLSFLLFSATFRFAVSRQFPSPYFLFHSFTESDQTKYTLSAHYVPLKMRRLGKLICVCMSFISVFVCCVCGVHVVFMSLCLYVMSVCVYTCVCLFKGSTENTCSAWPVCLGLTRVRVCSGFLAGGATLPSVWKLFSCI